MKEYFVLFFLITGALFILIASIGLLKMPDVYLRMSASTIAGTLGVALMLIGTAIYFWELRVLLHVLAIVIFMVLTVPIGAHMLGRVSHIINLPMWHKTSIDDMKGKYCDKTNTFRGMDKDNDCQESNVENNKKV